MLLLCCRGLNLKKLEGVLGGGHCVANWNTHCPSKFWHLNLACGDVVVMRPCIVEWI